MPPKRTNQIIVLVICIKIPKKLSSVYVIETFIMARSTKSLKTAITTFLVHIV